MDGHHERIEVAHRIFIGTGAGPIQQALRGVGPFQPTQGRDAFDSPVPGNGDGCTDHRLLDLPPAPAKRQEIDRRRRIEDDHQSDFASSTA